MTFKDRVFLEFRQLWQYKGTIALCIFLMVYVASALGRNLAYYRAVQGPRLNDLGFELIPELPEHLKIWSEVLIYVNHIIGIMVILSPLFLNTDYSIVLIGKRILTILTVGHMVRIVMYLSTTLPGPASHCQPGSPEFHPPTTLWDVFFRFSTYNDLNCGDLIFSGHIFQNISFSILTRLYARRLYHPILANVLIVAQMVNTALQVVFVLAARNHYSIDLVVGIYVTITLWLLLCKTKQIENEVDTIRHAKQSLESDEVPSEMI